MAHLRNYATLDDCEIVAIAESRPQLVRQGRGTSKFLEFVIFDQPTGHGLGVGDIAGNGRQEIVLTKGWLEALSLDREMDFSPRF